MISYAPPGDGFQGQLVVDRLDDTYVAFRRAMGQMIINTSCPCKACANIGSLDLKFLIHHGEYAVQHLGVQDELVGAEVNQLFRLTKNSIRQSLGLPGYMAFTAEAIAALALPGFVDGLITHTENDPERGVSCFTSETWPRCGRTARTARRSAFLRRRCCCGMSARSRCLWTTPSPCSPGLRRGFRCSTPTRWRWS